VLGFANLTRLSTDLNHDQFENNLLLQNLKIKKLQFNPFGEKKR